MELNRVHRVDGLVPCRNALISVADKSGVGDFVASLWEIVPDLTIYSSGGTYGEILKAAEKTGKREQLIEVARYTGQPEMQGGLVKTLDFRIYLGILSETYNEAHQTDLKNQDAVSFDLTVCNFYPFEKIAAGTNVTVEDLRTHIDIGGPAMLRASAKNFLRVTALHSPADYPGFLAELRAHGGHTSLEYRSHAAAQAFQYTAHYENAIAGALGSYIRSSDLSGVYEIRNGDDL